MTPLVDVVFLLIIFFMAAAQFQKDETQKVDLPEAEKAQMPPASPAMRLTINVVLPDVILVQGEHMAPGGLAAVIRRARAAALEAGKESLEVKIRGDRDVDWGLIQPILLACANNGVWKVAFAVTPRRSR
jgi:biopolymer transport protein ExbD